MTEFQKEKPNVTDFFFFNQGESRCGASRSSMKLDVASPKTTFEPKEEEANV